MRLRGCLRAELRLRGCLRAELRLRRSLLRRSLCQEVRRFVQTPQGANGCTESLLRAELRLRGKLRMCRPLRAKLRLRWLIRRNRAGATAPKDLKSTVPCTIGKEPFFY